MEVLIADGGDCDGGAAIDTVLRSFVRVRGVEESKKKSLSLSLTHSHALSLSLLKSRSSLISCLAIGSFRGGRGSELEWFGRGVGKNRRGRERIVRKYVGGRRKSLRITYDTCDRDCDTRWGCCRPKKKANVGGAKRGDFRRGDRLLFPLPSLSLWACQGGSNNKVETSKPIQKSREEEKRREGAGQRVIYSVRGRRRSRMYTRP